MYSYIIVMNSFYDTVHYVNPSLVLVLTPFIVFLLIHFCHRKNVRYYFQ